MRAPMLLPISPDWLHLAYARLLHHAFQRHLFTRTLLPALLLATRTTVFPLNARPVSLEVSSNTNIGIAAGSKQKEAESLPLTTAPPPPQSTSRRQPQQAGLSSDQRSNGAKINSIKRACARSILQLIPKRVALAVFAIPTDKEFCDATNLSADNSNSNPAPLVLPLSARAATTPPISVSQSFNTTPSLSDAAGSENRSEGNIDSDPIQSNLGLCSTRTSTQTTGIVGNKTAKLNLSTSHHEQGEGRDEEEQLLCAIEHEVLDLFSDSYCNKHLVYSIVEAVLAKLIPELTEQGIGELMAERGL
ncbi:hypothetical protein PRK78_000751 [Emydomyces testavorans]|uniref:PXA domain-containing protein n=1 Tax=Emydomyces testavorans TaxID=2070801 RepID=A0AAF0DB88_9EURO|nr:hypothetical protein PRK78_000751 [Emydomyces testavorans]